ncbi:MAG: hypothetical protein ABSG80_03320 [Verrucomicrobiota bacterium]|jgi:hypothetical protein
MKKLLAALAIVILATQLLAQSNMPVRLALIAETDEASAASDVLTVQLSANQKIQLLERNEIEKVYREQGLSAANKDYLKLGRILGADGLMLFDVVRTKQATNLMTRLIAVKPGIILANEGFSWPLASINEWSSSFAEHLNLFFPKLTVLAKEAIPISVVNLRSAVQSAESQEAERQLKLLAIQRLSQERQFFVLERQQMQLLGEEKELKSDDSAFWDGSYLLEGIVDQNGYSKDTITINARLTPPKGGAPLLFEVSGSRTNLVDVINHLAAKVAELLKINSTVKEWNAADEAQQYFEEAKWALKWGVYSEAQAAAESAWALGKRDLDCALVRVKSYLADAEPTDPNDLYEKGSYRDETGTPGDIDSFIRELTNAQPGKVIFERNGNVVHSVILKKQPDQFKFIRLVHALELYEAQLNSLQWSDPTIRKEWCELGTSLLETAGQWLRDYCLAKQARAGVETQLESARRLSGKIATALVVMPEANEERFWNAVGGFGVFWCETPEEGVALYRKLFGLRRFSSVRKHVTGCYPVFCNKLLLPVLAAWHEEDDNHIARLWRDLVEEMCASTNSELRGNGYFIVCAEADNAQTFVKALRISNKCFYGNDSSIVSDLVTLSEEGRDKFTRDQWMLARQAKLDLVVELETQEARSNAMRSIPPLSPMLSRPFQFLTNSNLPALAKPAPVAPQKVETQPSNLLEVTRFWEIPLTNKLTFTNYSGEGENEFTMAAPSSVIAFCYREGYLWVEAEHEWGDVHPRFFFRVNLETFASETIPVDKDRYHPQDSYEFAGSFRTFEVYSNHLYASSSDGIKRYSLARKTWEDLPVPVGGHARITAFDGRIFLSSANAIIEMATDGRTSKVLASTRRRPPLTMLDTMDGYFMKVAPDWSSCKLFAPVLPGPDGSVMMFLIPKTEVAATRASPLRTTPVFGLNGRLYLLPRGASDWIPATQIAASREAERSFSTCGLLVLSALEYGLSQPPAPELYLIRAGSTNADCIIADKPGPGEQAYLNSMNFHIQPVLTRWTSPEGMRIADSPACLDGDTLWVLHGRPSDLNLTLLHYLPGQTKPVQYQLHLKQPDAGRIHSDWHFPYKWIQIEATPQGIVFGGAGVSGLWFVPSNELQRNNLSELSK